MEYEYNPQGVCSMKMIIQMDNQTIKNVKIIGGCQGNTKAISALVEGMNIDEAIKRMKGIDCGGKGTSCPDQLAQALEMIKEKIK